MHANLGGSISSKNGPILNKHNFGSVPRCGDCRRHSGHSAAGYQQFGFDSGAFPRIHLFSTPCPI
jgi:hypothetical protein